jgi:hypothetical protein
LGRSLGPRVKARSFGMTQQEVEFGPTASVSLVVRFDKEAGQTRSSPRSLTAQRTLVRNDNGSVLLGRPTVTFQPDALLIQCIYEFLKETSEFVAVSFTRNVIRDFAPRAMQRFLWEHRVGHFDKTDNRMLTRSGMASANMCQQDTAS